MILFTKGDVIESFHTLMRDRCVLPDELVDLWFLQAVSEYELEIGDIHYDEYTQEFDEGTPNVVALTLARLMQVMYIERELSRVNKINNIITNDIKLNGNGETKKYTYNELREARAKVAEMINKQKTSWYGD